MKYCTICNKKIELKGLHDYNKAIVNLGAVVKRTFPGLPWKYNARAKAWTIVGEEIFHEFYKKYRMHEDEIKRKLGGKFNGYSIIVDAEDSFLLISLD